jgi:very-short-patch-repair endonuclease
MRTVEKARRLRVNQTDVERLVWSRIRDRQLSGCKFRRQVPIGRYIVDFVCREAALIVELDGGQHSSITNYDADRTRWLE